MRTRKVLLVALPAKPHATLIAPGKKPPLRAGGDSGKPYVPEKIIGTLTLSTLKSIYTLISPIFSFK